VLEVGIASVPASFEKGRLACSSVRRRRRRACRARELRKTIPIPCIEETRRPLALSWESWGCFSSRNWYAQRDVAAFELDDGFGTSRFGMPSDTRRKSKTFNILVCYSVLRHPQMDHLDQHRRATCR